MIARGPPPTIQWCANHLEMSPLSTLKNFKVREVPPEEQELAPFPEMATIVEHAPVAEEAQLLNKPRERCF